MQALVSKKLSQINLPILAGRLSSRPVVVAAAAVAGLFTVLSANRLLNTLTLGNPLLLLLAKTWNGPEEIVLITGGSSGMGKIMAAEFAKRDIKVVVFDLRPPPKDAPLPADVAFYQVDITDDVRVHEVAERVRRDVGEPTVLINNAGIGHGQTLFDGTPDQVRRVFAVNAVAPLLLVREFVPAMAKRNHGHVVTMASMASFVVIANNVDYSCSKAAVLALHEGLRTELLQRYNAPAVRTTIVHPYWVQTPLLNDLVHNKGFNDGILQPKDVADAVVKQVLSGRSGQIILPSHLAVASMLRGMPTWAQELIRNYKGSALKVTGQ